MVHIYENDVQQKIRTGESEQDKIEIVKGVCLFGYVYNTGFQNEIILFALEFHLF